jgi:hypothetical protein
MFADSVWQSQGSDSHRGWITLASFVVQTLAVATLLVLPLLHTEGLLPMHSIVEPVFSPSLAGGTSDIRRPRNQRSNLANTTLVVPRPTSHEMKLISPEDSQPQLDVRQFAGATTQSSIRLRIRLLISLCPQRLWSNGRGFPG